MEGNIPVPAESLRTIAESATTEVRDLRDSGFKASARSTERAIAEAFNALDARDGEYVSINGSDVSHLAAAADHGEPETSRHIKVARVYLEQYGVW